LSQYTYTALSIASRANESINDDKGDDDDDDDQDAAAAQLPSIR